MSSRTHTHKTPFLNLDCDPNFAGWHPDVAIEIHALIAGFITRFVLKQIRPSTLLVAQFPLLVD